MRAGEKDQRTQRGRSGGIVAAYHFIRTGGWADEQYQCGYCRERGLFTTRNCSRADPASNVLVIRDPSYQWQPVYMTAKDTPYSPEIDVPECPRSFISAESITTVEQHRRARVAHRACGAQMYGPDLSRWPAREVDVLVLLDNEQIKTENSKFEAEQSEK